MIVAISGAKGFIGKNLISILSNNEYSIISIDIEDGLDLSKHEQLDLIPSFDVFVHLANLSYVPDSYSHPESFYRINYLTTLNTLELCRKYNARLVYLSSYIYGKPDYLPVDEIHKINPFNPYAQSKYISEILCEGYHRDFGIKTTILRPFNVYGVGQNGKLLIPEIIQQLSTGQKIIKLRDASPRRDYVNVLDVVDAIKKCIDNSINFKRFNLCSGISYSVKELTEIINSELTEPVEFQFSESDRVNEVTETVGSLKKIHEELNWFPKITLKEGLKAIIKHSNL